MSRNIIVALSLAVIVQLGSTETNCHQKLLDAGASSKFGDNVAHAMHSITLDVLKRFNPAITEQNNIPTLNFNLTSDQPILPYAPDRIGPHSDQFKSPGMKWLDAVLSNMNRSHFNMEGHNTIELIVHAMHMEEIWTTVKEIIDNKIGTPIDESTCECVTDVENNGILDGLRVLALQFREPQLIFETKLTRNRRASKISYNVSYRRRRNASGQQDFGQIQKPDDEEIVPTEDTKSLKRDRRASKVSYNVSYRRRRNVGSPQDVDEILKPVDVEEVIPTTDSTPLKRNRRGYGYNVSYRRRRRTDSSKQGLKQILLSEDDEIVPITDAKSWNVWAEDLIEFAKNYNAYDAALYLSCAVNY